VEREGNVVRVYMAHIRSHQRRTTSRGSWSGDTVYFHHTNVEQDWDVVHGFAIKGMNTPRCWWPRQTKTMKWVPTGRGLPVLLHGLLLGAAPGDAGIRAGLAARD
jgi:nitrous-oxide reductase